MEFDPQVVEARLKNVPLNRTPPSKEFLATLADCLKLFEVNFRMEFPPELVQAFKDELADIPPKLLYLAAKRCIREGVRSFQGPEVADVRHAAHAVMESIDTPEAPRLPEAYEPPTPEEIAEREDAMEKLRVKLGLSAKMPPAVDFDKRREELQRQKEELLKKRA